MKRVIIVHGWSGANHNHWQPWLKEELEKNGFEVFMPNMPDTDTPVIEKWVGYLEKIVGKPDSETYFIGHSIGCQAILRYAEKLFSPIGGAVFVAGWFNLENMETEEEKETAKPWIEIPINAEKIKSVLGKSTLIISNNDPYGAFEVNKEKFAEIGSKIIVLKKAGHITEGDGFTKLTEALSEILSFSKK